MAPERCHPSASLGTEAKLVEHEVREKGPAQLADHEHATDDDIEAAELSEEVQDSDEAEDSHEAGSSQAEEGSEVPAEDLAHEDTDKIAQDIIQEIERRGEVNAKRFRSFLERSEVEVLHAEKLGLDDDEVDMTRKAYEKDLAEFDWDPVACPFGDYISYPISVDEDGNTQYGPSIRLTEKQKEHYDQINRDNGVKCEPECDSCRRKRMKKERGEEIAQNGGG